MFLSLLLLVADPAALASMRQLAQLDARVAMIGERLARSGLCKGMTSGPGWVLQDITQYDQKMRQAAREALKLGDAPTVVTVLPGSAAAAAGVQAGDQIVAIGGGSVEAPGKRAKAYDRMGVVEQRIEQALKAGALTIGVRRGDAVREVEIVPQPGCASRFQLLTGPGLNAKADGTYVQVSGALVEFVQSDDELALVIAHELAHNILGHRARLDAVGVSRGLLAGFGKNRGRIRETELEADRLALYLMARAGYDPSIAPAFWQRFGRKLVPGFLSDGTHPGTAERVRRAEAEIARIRAQQAAGQQPTP